jgi:hypothetical protein
MILWFFQWLMVQFLQISQGLENAVCSSTIACLPNGSVVGLGWMILLLIPLEKMRLLERAFEEDEVFEVVNALNGDTALGINVCTMTFF